MTTIPARPLFARVTADGKRVDWDTGERQRLRDRLRQLAGERVDIIVRKHQSQRSLDQNRYWHWAMSFLAAEATQWDGIPAEHDAIHYWLLCQYFGTYDVRGYDVPRRTSSALTTKEFSELIEWMLDFAARDLGVRVPAPNEVDLPGEG